MDLLKKIIISVLFTVIIYSCNNSISHVNSEQYGELSITLGSTRGWVNSDISSVATYCEVLIYNADVQLSSGAIANEGTYNALVPMGTYDILVIVGANELALGFGEAKAVTIEPATTTNTSIELNTYEITTTWPSSAVLINTEFTVVRDITFPISDIGMSSSTLLIDGTYASNTYVQDGNKYTLSTTLTTPITSGTYTILTQSSNMELKLENTDYGLSGTIFSLFSSQWSMGPYHSDDTIYNLMSPEFSHDLEVVSSTEGTLNLSLIWGADS